MLAIRPENISIGGAAPAEGNVVRGRISFASYLGNTLRYDVETPGGQVLKADIRDPWHHDLVPIGREVAAGFPASVTLAVADDLQTDVHRRALAVTLAAAMISRRRDAGRRR